MRILILSDFHSNQRFNKVYDFLKTDDFIKKCKIDKIIVNGNMIGATELAPNYGYRYKQDEYFWDINKKRLFLEIAPETAKKFVQAITNQDFVKSKTNLSELIFCFVEERYSWILTALRKLSKLRHTYFNFGTLESPLHFKVLEELALILGLDVEIIKSNVDEEKLQEIFSQFKQRLEQLDADERFTYLSLKNVEDEDTLFVGIAGIADSEEEEDLNVQEKLTTEILEETRTKTHGMKIMIVCNNTEGIIVEPFNFIPGSESARAFIEQQKTEPLTKIFVQSHKHFMTTHFYKEKNWHFILNNSAVNNGLFNIIEIEGEKVNCWDVDPELYMVRALAEYDKERINPHAAPEERLALNYASPEEIIQERSIKGCEHM